MMVYIVVSAYENMQLSIILRSKCFAYLDSVIVVIVELHFTETHFFFLSGLICWQNLLIIKLGKVTSTTDDRVGVCVLTFFFFFVCSLFKVDNNICKIHSFIKCNINEWIQIKPPKIWVGNYFWSYRPKSFPFLLLANIMSKKNSYVSSIVLIVWFWGKWW